MEFCSKLPVFEHWNLLFFWLIVAIKSIFLATAASGIGDREGFLSLQCGANENQTDAYNISWIPDDPYITTGNKSTVTFPSGNSTVKTSLRFFPNSGDRICYSMSAQNSRPILVRSTFIYKNYDGFKNPPSFKVFLGRTKPTQVNLSVSDPWVEEFITAENGDTLSLCLIATEGGGAPLISSLEFRPLPANAYSNGTGPNSNKMLRKMFRINCGYTTKMLRYPADSYDRIWDVDQNFAPRHLSKGFDIPVNINSSGIPESPPDAVLQSARILVRTQNLFYNFHLSEKANYFVIAYFTKIVAVYSTFDVLLNGDIIKSNFTLQRGEAGRVLNSTHDSTTEINITIHNVSFHPQINALEVYQIADIPLGSSQSQVSALKAIQQVYNFNLGWEDDPCSPFPWKGVECDEANEVISLDLSNMNLEGPISVAFGDLLDLQKLDLHNNSLTGQIQNFGGLSKLQTLNLSFNRLNAEIPDLSTLTSLQDLDIKNNSFHGTVPESLGSLTNLRLLNLENNQLSGILPSSLNKSTLSLRTSGNLCLKFLGAECSPGPPPIQTPEVTEPHIPKNKNHIKAIIAGVVGGVACLLIVGVALLVFYIRRQKSDDGSSISRADMRNWNTAKRFSFKEIKVATNSFKDTIGRGSFGSVYLGKLPDGKRVAVKVRFDPSQLAADSFINEVFLLSQVHHQNLVTLEGFCQESKHQILVYEYLPGGALTDHLYGSRGKRKPLDWKTRLKIAVDAATGLEYLHNGSDPRIIHRDVKCSNILLDSDINAKVCDFGLSKQMVQADATHVTTVVKGTAGYLDPEYYSTQQLTEKSDVYSFGVVLLELICGREPLSHSGSPDTYNLVLWAKPHLQAENYDVVDPSLENNYKIESLKRVARVAAQCVERDASQRPTMAEVLSELKEALVIEQTQTEVNEELV
ncbi:hypothetical protein SUGI_0070710 [Cryptomeria japonica]|uniref:probable LRR receptor-like serine/threonine-protein kinase At5g48740 n=1 Tax=Cryptomeria japonica TaxID=3369 RepID=UPI002408C360|nr:probable LRR receptor-like serine/threonine-protein kinase At5g48740 [Cryptomeria japonica]GLJ07608.1 hypothetical protein SUGI_0070710 [Cryptomeria japonica]